MQNLKKQAQDFLQKSLQVWSQNGVDVSYVEALDFNAHPLSNMPRRGRVQARQILVFAMAHCLGFDGENKSYLKQTETLYPQIMKIYGIDGKLIFKKGKDKVDEHLFAYEQAFLLMAQSWLYRATGNMQYLNEAEVLWGWLEDALLNQKYDGFNVGLPSDQDDPRQQNPHMHLFEASMVCFQNFKDPIWQGRADWLFNLFQNYFWNEDHHSLIEFFTPDWQIHPQSGKHIEPGHHFEWCWLLGEYQKLQPKNISVWQNNVFKRGIEIGLNENGFGRDETYLDGRECRSTSRLWVQCELLKAYLAMYHLTNDHQFKQKADKLLQDIFSSYFIADKGIWYDQLSPKGENISQDSPASTFYHILIALNEYIKMAK